MLERLKDFLGINRYVVHFDFPSEVFPGKRNKGAWGPYRKSKCERFASIGRLYFGGSYVVERYHGKQPGASA